MLLELSRREKNAGIKPDEDLDIFIKVCEKLSFLPSVYVYVVCTSYTCACIHKKVIACFLGCGIGRTEAKSCCGVHNEGTFS